MSIKRLSSWVHPARIFFSLIILCSIFVSYAIPTEAGAADPPVLVKYWGGYGSADGQFSRPGDIAFDSLGNVYVADGDNHRVQKFDSNGNLLLKFGSGPSSDDGKFNHPHGIGVDSSGNIYVGDVSNNRIQKFDSSGNFLLKWGAAGSTEGNFNIPQGLAVDSENTIYVADYSNDRVQRFDSDGNFLLALGGSNSLPSGSDPGKFFQPTDVAIDTSGNVYVVDFWSYVQVFTRLGVYQRRFSTTNSENTGVCLDADDNIYVARRSGNTIKKYDNTGTALCTFGSPLANALEVAAGPLRTIYVVTNDDYRVNKFAPATNITLTSPVGGETWGTGSSHNITWTSDNLSGNVNIQLSRNGGTTYTNIISNTPNDGTQAWTVTAPVTNTARIKVVSVSKPAIFGASPADFSILAPPASPTLLLPTSGKVILTLTPTLDWADVSGAASYGVQVSTASTFATTLVNQSGLTASTYTVPGSILNWNTTYFWRANAVDSNGIISKWSAVRNFKTATGPPPNDPTSLTATPVSATQVNLSWNDNSSNEAGFKVERKTGTGNFAVIATVGPNVTSYNNTSGLKASTAYIYRVRAYLTTTIVSNYTNEANATTLPPPPAAPTLSSPAAGATLATLTPTLDWNEPLGADEYGLQVSTVNTFATTLVDENGLTESNYNITSGLEWNKTYYWRVNAVNASASTSKWSATRSFKTATGPPPNAPGNLDGTPYSNTRIDLTWDDNSSNEAGFKVERKKTGGNFVLIATVGPNVTAYSNTSGLTANTAYIYRVRAYQGTLYSTYSNEKSITTLPPPPAVPTLQSPANGAPNQAQPITLEWNDVTGASTYRVQVSTVNTFATIVVDDASLTSSSYLIPPILASNTVYYWHVNAKGASGSTSAWSGTRSFKTAP